MSVGEASLETAALAVRPVRTARKTFVAPYARWILPSTLVVLFLLMAFFPALFTPLDPDATEFKAALEPPSADHIFGTDPIGRDLYTRVVYGAGLSLIVGVAATVFSIVVGAIVGAIAGIAGGIADRLISRVLDILLAFPGILLAMLTVVVLGPSIVNLAIAIGLSSFPGSARLVRAQVMLVVRSGYVETAKTLGRSKFHLVTTHVIPNSISPLLVLTTIGVGGAILSAAALSFIGLGAAPPQSEWGLLLSDSRAQLQDAPWLGFFPGVVLVVAVIAITALGRLVQERFEGRAPN
ncbi:ABC transporter permease [Agromyces sp. MMS24-JH15]|uniref:ABC transporter permease n=1 Tax=Agromyces sp. MMS24-JH15 TaxID=3243765 RepID=UPI00374A0135